MNIVKKIFNPFKNLQYIWTSSIIRKNIHENITLYHGAPLHHHLRISPDDMDVVITLDTESAKTGDRFVIKHDGAGLDDHFLEIKEGVTTIDKIYARVIKEFIFDGANWTGADLGTHPRDNYEGVGIGENANPAECGVAIGQNSDGRQDGIAIGNSTDGHAFGTAIGYSADGNNKGASVGHTALSYMEGVAVGYGTNTHQKTHSIAIGYRSHTTREAELAMNIGNSVYNDIRKAYFQIIIGSWIEKTTNATPKVMSVNGSSSRFTIRPQSALTFKIMVTARDNTSGDCAAYLFDGLIKRDGANNTTLCVCNKIVLHEDDDTWDCDVAADDTNEALQITVTGNTNTVQWAARLDGVETSFTEL